MSPSRETTKEVYHRIEMNTKGLQERPGTRKNTNFNIWYVGSDAEKHYFGEYLKQHRLLFPFENSVTYVYLLRSEMSIVQEVRISEKLRSGTDVGMELRESWFVPTSVPVSKDVFDGPMVLATLIPAHEE